MGDSQKQRADAIFDTALDLTGERRREFLERECGADRALRARVERLLDHAATTTGELVITGAESALNSVIAANSAEESRRQPGEKIGRFVIERELGRGGMGVVYAAEDERLRRTVAIKLLHGAEMDSRGRERFLREARTAAQLNHPQIVSIHDADEQGDSPYLVMEFVNGASLETQPPESMTEALRFSQQICDALAHAHQKGIVHRDLKPGNLLRGQEEGEPSIKLTDLGIALARDAARITRAGAIAGTPVYMAPEQALGQPVDGRADLYALGVMLYEWTTGRPPFCGDDALAIVSQHLHAPVVPPRTYCNEIAPAVEQLVLRLLAKRPEERFRDAGEVRGAIDAALETPQATGGDAVGLQGLRRGRLVGRRTELEQLRTRWSAARSGENHLILISGEPGVGKSRLAIEATAMARLDGATVLSGGCYENEATTPYLPFLEATRRFVSEQDDALLRELLGDTAAEVARLAPEVDTRLGPFPKRTELSPQEERLRLFDAFARFLKRVADRCGLLIYLDDVQWADHGSLSLLHYLMRQLPKESMLFIATYREIELDRTHPLAKRLVDWNREGFATRIKLDRFGAGETREMIESLLGQSDVANDWLQRVHSETEGNPFFVEEILKALIADGGLVRESLHWQRRRTTGDFTLPQSVKAAIGSRLERIPTECCEVLRAAAVLGKEFAFDELVAIAGRDEDELLDALDEATAAHLIVAGGGDRFRFTHDKIREVLYEESNPIRRRRIHARIAAGLESLQAQGSDVSVEDLAYHFVESGDDEKGLIYSERAGVAAASLFAFEEALEMLDRARACADALERPKDLARIDGLSAESAFQLGNLKLAATLFERAISSTEETRDRGVLRAKAAEVYVISMEPIGRDHVKQALVEIDCDRDPTAFALAKAMGARYDHLDGRLTTAIETYQETIELVQEHDEPSLLVRILSFLSGTLQHLARFEESDRVARECIEIGQQREVPAGVMLGHEFLQENAFYRGYWAESVRHGAIEEQLAIDAQAGERYGWSLFRGIPLRSWGRRDEAEEVLMRGIDHNHQLGDLRIELFLRGALAMLRMDEGRFEEAARIIYKALETADEAGFVAHRISLRANQIQIALACGDRELAADSGSAAAEVMRTNDTLGLALVYQPDVAEGLLAGDQVDAAEAMLDEHLKLAERTAAGHRVAQNRRVRSKIATLRGQSQDAIELLAAAIDGFRESESRVALKRAERELAALRAG